MTLKLWNFNGTWLFLNIYIRKSSSKNRHMTKQHINRIINITNRISSGQEHDCLGMSRIIITFNISE